MPFVDTKIENITYERRLTLKRDLGGKSFIQFGCRYFIPFVSKTTFLGKIYYKIKTYLKNKQIFTNFRKISRYFGKSFEVKTILFNIWASRKRGGGGGGGSEKDKIILYIEDSVFLMTSTHGANMLKYSSQ